MCDKPHLFAADSSKKPETPEFIMPENMIMPENIRKRRSITVKEKLDILNMVDSGHKLSTVARVFGISSSTASTIVKERYKIKLLSDHYNIDPERKRMRLGIYRDVDEAVHLWFRQMRMKNIPINGPMLQQKAREFAIQLGHQNFEGSSGWLFRFRERHGLSVKTMRVNDDKNAFNYPGVGMTDDEIVTSVCQNTVHSLNFCDNRANYKHNNRSGNEALNHAVKLEVPENYLVPEVELTAYEPTISLHEAVTLANKLTSFLKGHDVPSDILKSMNTVNNFIDHDLRNQLKQRKITDYFNRGVCAPAKPRNSWDLGIPEPRNPGDLGIPEPRNPGDLGIPEPRNPGDMGIPEPRNPGDMGIPEPRNPGDMGIPEPRNPGDMGIPEPRNPGDMGIPEPRNPGDMGIPEPQNSLDLALTISGPPEK